MSPVGGPTCPNCRRLDGHTDWCLRGEVRVHVGMHDFSDFESAMAAVPGVDEARRYRYRTPMKGVDVSLADPTIPELVRVLTGGNTIEADTHDAMVAELRRQIVRYHTPPPPRTGTRAERRRWARQRGVGVTR